MAKYKSSKERRARSVKAQAVVQVKAAIAVKQPYQVPEWVLVPYIYTQLCPVAELREPIWVRR